MQLEPRRTVFRTSTSAADLFQNCQETSEKLGLYFVRMRDLVPFVGAIARLGKVGDFVHAVLYADARSRAFEPAVRGDLTQGYRCERGPIKNL